MSYPDHSSQVRTGLAVAFVYMGMQTFAIPGTTSLSLVLGALFGRWLGFTLVALTSTAGMWMHVDVTVNASILIRAHESACAAITVQDVRALAACLSGMFNATSHFIEFTSHTIELNIPGAYH
eukprot:1161914-Pelagomonas_calceolata.AAC.2